MAFYDFVSNQVSFIDPSTYNDSDPVWNKEGTHIAFIRNANIKYEIGFTPRPTAEQPWEIRLAEVATNKASTLFKADLGQGSRLVGDLPAVATQLIWTHDN